MVETVVPPPDLVALAGPDDAGYREGFVAQCRSTGDVPRTAEAWARATLEQAPRSMRETMLRAWPLLGIHLGPVGSPDHVHGWRILRNDPDAIVLGVESSVVGTVRIVLRVEGDARPTLAWAMLIRYHGLRGRAAWAAIGPVHRPFVRRLLDVVTGPDRFPVTAAGGSVPPV